MSNKINMILAAIVTGFAGFILLLTLSILSVTFIVVGLALPVVSILNLLSIVYIPFNIFFFQVTGIPQVIIAIVIGIIFIILGYNCIIGMKTFTKWRRDLLNKLTF